MGRQLGKSLLAAPLRDPEVRDSRKAGLSLTLRCSHDKQTWPQLRYAKVGSVEDPP